MAIVLLGLGGDTKRKKALPPVCLRYPSQVENWSVATPIYIEPCVQTLKTREEEKTYNAPELNFLAMAENLALVFNGHDKLDVDFIMRLFASTKNIPEEARLDEAINSLIRLWSEMPAVTFEKLMHKETPRGKWRWARRMVRMQTLISSIFKTFTFSVEPPLPPGITLGARSGIITGWPLVEVDSRDYTITCSNVGGSLSVTLTIRVSCTMPPINLTYPDLRKAIHINQQVVFYPLIVGCVGSWSVTPELPAGLRLDAQGVIDGTPTELRSERRYAVVAKNHAGSASFSFLLAVVQPEPSNLRYHVGRGAVAPAAKGGFCGKAATLQLPMQREVCLRPTCDGTVDTYEVKPELPAGLSLDQKTGIISGTPTEQSPVKAYTVTAENETGSCKATLALAVKLLPPTSVSYPDVDDIYCVGEIIDVHPNVSGGATLWAVEPSLPKGLTLNAQTGVICGSAEETADETSYTITASNEAGGTSTVITFEIFAEPPEGLCYPGVAAEYLVGQEVHLTPELGGVFCAVTYFVMPELPAGMKIDAATGHISGTPQAASEKASYKITAGNTLGESSCELVFSVTGKPRRQSRRQSVQEAPGPQQSSFGVELDNAQELADMPEEPDPESRPTDWMMWIVHRAWLNDPALTAVKFAGMPMPLPQDEPRIAPKLMKALAKSRYITSLDLADSMLRASEGPALAGALRSNTVLQVLNVDSNLLNSADVAAMAGALKDNSCSALTAWLCSQQDQGSNFGKETEQAVAEMMQQNRTITKLTIPCHDPHWRSIVESGLQRNSGAERRQKKAALGSSKAVRTVQERTLSCMKLETAPEKTLAECFAGADGKMDIARIFTLEKKKWPTKEQWQRAATNSGQPMKYSEIAPLAKDFRRIMLDAALECQVLMVDDKNRKSSGKLRAWVEKNDRWSLEVDEAETGARFRFMASREPVVEVSSQFAAWLRDP